MSTNALGPFLLNCFLEPILKRTAVSSEPNSVRIIWLASLLNIGTAEGGIIWDDSTGGPKVLKNAMNNYMESKVGNFFLAYIAAKRLSKDGIISLASSSNPRVRRLSLTCL